MTVTAFQQANQLLREGKLEEAIAAYRSAISQNPDFYLAYHNLGETLEKLGRWEEAIEAYRRAVQLKPGAAWSHWGLSQALQQVGRPEEAQKVGDLAIEIDPKSHHQGRLVMASDAGKDRLRVGVCGWELSHNAAGRAYTLAQLYGGFAEVELIGCLFPKYGGQVWEPIRETQIPCHTIRVEDEGRFIEQALGLVLAHFYEVVHLSKPRMPNIILGLLYKLLWGARVIVDIDDEELTFVKASEPLDLAALLESEGKLPPFRDWDGGKWTRLAVGLARAFDGVTVANVALQKRYGGVVIRHARDEGRFVPSADLKRRSRERFGIAQDKRVVLFFGTPKEYKGLVATARALASLGRKDVVFAIIGNFRDGKLKEELQAIAGVDYLFVGNQPFESIPDVVAVGDICVLLQDVGSEVSQFQIPAKLSDALGMGLVVLLSETAAVADVIESGAVVPVAEGDLAAVLGRVLSDEAECDRLRVRGRELLAAEFGFGVNRPRLAAVMDGVRGGVGVLSDELNFLLAGFPAVGSVLSGLVSHKTITKSQKIIVYTCNFGNYESVKEPQAVDPRVEYILFTDRKDIKSPTWKVVQIKDFPENPRRASRLPKILPHKYLPDHEISVYLDSTFTIKESDIHKMVEQCMEGNDIALYKHYERNCVYDEINFCEKSDIRNVDSVTCSKIRAKYDSINYPKNNGLFENGFIFRKNTPKIKQLNEMWWRECSLGSERDQFTLMYCLWSLSIKPHAITIGEQCRVNPYVIFTKHTYQHTITDIRLSDTRGVMLIAFGLDYDKIGPHLAKTIRLFSDIPIYVCTNLPDFIRSSEWQHISNITFKLFDMHDHENRVIKTQLAQYTIFDETLYIDVDSEVLSENFLEPFKLLRNGISILSPIWKIFSYNDLLDRSKQSNKMKKFLKVTDDLGLYGKISFVAGGVCYFKKNECFEIFNDFHRYWIDFGRLEDMPALNKALLQNIDKFKILSNFEYNSTQATVIRSLHSSTMKVPHMENFTRKRYNDTQDEWYFVSQGSTELFKKEKIIFIYDVPGWAFYDISWYVKKYLNQYYEIDLFARDKIGENADITKFLEINQYKAILIHTYSFLKNIPKKFYNKIILGFSSHKKNNFNDFDEIRYRFSNSEDIFNLFDPKFKRYYLPNGVDTNFYFNVCRKLSDNNIRVGCVGSLKWSEHKGKHRVREMCTQARMINKSLFVDPAYALNKNQMLRYYNEIDIFIVSSVSETGPNPLLEAMSCGLVCISNKVGLATKLIKHGFNGFLVDDYNDISTYVKYLEILKNDRELYRLMSLRNKEIISQFDWSVMSVNYKIMLDEIVTLLD